MGFGCCGFTWFFDFKQRYRIEEVVTEDGIPEDSLKAHLVNTLSIKFSDKDRSPRIPDVYEETTPATSRETF